MDFAGVPPGVTNDLIKSNLESEAHPNTAEVDMGIIIRRTKYEKKTETDGGTDGHT